MQRLKAILSSVAAKILIVPFTIIYETWTDFIPFHYPDTGAARFMSSESYFSLHFGGAALIMVPQYLLVFAPHLICRHWALRAWAVPIYLCSAIVPALYLYLYVANDVYRHVTVPFADQSVGILGLTVTALYIYAYLVPSRGRSLDLEEGEVFVTRRRPSDGGAGEATAGLRPPVPLHPRPGIGHPEAPAPVGSPDTIIWWFKAYLTNPAAKILIVPFAPVYAFMTMGFSVHYSDVETQIHTVASAASWVIDWIILSQLLVIGAPYLIDRPLRLRVCASVFYSCGIVVPILYLYFYVVDGVYEHTIEPFVLESPVILGVTVTVLYLLALALPPRSETSEQDENSA